MPPMVSWAHEMHAFCVNIEAVSYSTERVATRKRMDGRKVQNENSIILEKFEWPDWDWVTKMVSKPKSRSEPTRLATLVVAPHSLLFERNIIAFNYSFELLTRRCALVICLNHASAMRQSLSLTSIEIRKEMRGETQTNKGNKEKCNFKSNKFWRTIISEENAFNEPLN